MSRPITIALHGGAGNLVRYRGTGRLEEAEAFLSTLIDDLYVMLEGGSAALDVVTHACVRMEDSALFHAGRGSSPNTKGYVECDASIMCGRTRAAGAVASVRSVKNPILAARTVMEQTDHVLFVGTEAELLAEHHGLAVVDANYFQPCDTAAIATEVPSAHRGTVGAVALDLNGILAAATTTGGTLRKTAGRVGDTPIIGAGTYAANRVGAVSCTGVGEYFIRTAAAHTIVSRMQLLGETVGVAAGTAMSDIEALGGNGGIIAIDDRGNVAMPYNTTGMYRAVRTSRGERLVASL
ncbi:MAG: isoaspartyl peptidase/L-asparaginase [Candidatus Kapabacteria bacterium]|nr:isoaspartyl peptidase/L-asparaginase [Candidatus Kapabacteria bacterium]